MTGITPNNPNKIHKAILTTRASGSNKPYLVDKNLRSEALRHNLLINFQTIQLGSTAAATLRGSRSRPLMANSSFMRSVCTR